MTGVTTMTFSDEMKDKMNQFAKEQSKFYLEDAEMTYIEQLRRKTGQAKGKITAALAKFRSRSDTALEAENDMVLYMSDYMNDLMAEGLSEEEAFERARQELRFRSDTKEAATLQDRFAEYYQNRDPADYEAIGLFYAAFVILGMVIGALTGFFGGGGRMTFLGGGWIDTLIGVAVGLFIGVGLGLLANAILVLRKSR